ncbi:MAG: Ig-like domain-containing protein [Pseudomonadota bacterium]
MRNTHHRLGRAITLALGLAAVLPVGAQTRPANGVEPDAAITAQGRAVAIPVLANDAERGTDVRVAIVSRPANGSATVQGGIVRYAPRAGFTGTDRFEYMAASPRRAGFGTVMVDVGRALVLRGRVTDAPITNAEVDALLGDHVFATQADANGDYSLEVIAVDGGEMVTVGAQGVGVQSTANFVSVAGEFDRLAQEAGEDGVLTRDENNQVQVTNVSTAQAYLMQVANDGEPITSDTELVAARESVDNAELLRLAGAIKLVVDGGYALPAGTGDVLALISDPAALEPFLAAVEAEQPGALAEAMNAIAGDPDLTVPATAADFLGGTTLVFELGKPGTISTGFVSGHRMELNADGTGAYVQNAPNANPAVSWTFEEGRAVIVPHSPAVLTNFPFIAGVGQVRQLLSTSRYEISRLFKGADGRDSLAVTTTTHATYPDNPELPPETQVGTSTNHGIRDIGLLPFQAAELAGSTRSLYISDTPYRDTNFSGAALHSFAADGTGTRQDGQGFTWTVNLEGRLQVAYPSGAQASYARLNFDGRKGEGIASDWRSVDGRRSAAQSLSMVRDAAPGFTVETAQRDWQSGFYLSRTDATPDNTDFWIVLGAAQQGWAVNYGAGGPFPLRIGWTVTEGMMQAPYYRNGSNQPVHFCQIGVDGCRLVMQRRWTPVAVDGARIYVLEEFLRDLDGDGDLDVINQRNNFYEAGTAPDFTR